MGFFKKLSGLFSGASSKPDGDAYWIAARCNRCGEIIRARVSLSNDLSAEYGDQGVTYICRKQLMGEGTGERRCFQRIEVELVFDERRKLASREIRGGQWVDSAE